MQHLKHIDEYLVGWVRLCFCVLGRFEAVIPIGWIDSICVVVRAYTRISDEITYGLGGTFGFMSYAHVNIDLDALQEIQGVPGTVVSFHD